MSLPTVAAVMLVNGREAMVRKAVECVRAQTYGSLKLIVLDSGERIQDGSTIIGELRNRANALTIADIIAHFDSDDWSHACRIEEQAALLQASGADAVGYNEALFWDERCNPQSDGLDALPVGAWLYSSRNPSYALGGSLCYWRHVWERRPFEPTSQGEDWRFIAGLKTVGVTSLPPTCKEPRFVARIHAGNTSNAYSPISMQASEWRRVPEWDLVCRERMAL